MACFIVPAAEAVVTTVATRSLEAQEVEASATAATTTEFVHIPMSRKLRWLSGMLWGGSALLAFEHVWHGEIVPFWPFFTAATSPTEALAMLGEMATVGVGMAVLVTCAWGLMCIAADRIVCRAAAREA